MIELKDFKLVCRVVKAIVVCLALIFIAKFFFDTYHLLKQTYAMFRANYVLNDFLDLKGISDNYEAFIPYAKEQFNLVCMLAFREAVLGIIYFIWNRLIIPSKWLAVWHENGEIHPVLGRYIVYHLRENRYLNIKQAMNLFYWERVDRYYIGVHAKNEKLQKFLSAYDKDWEQDKLQNKS